MSTIRSLIIGTTLLATGAGAAAVLAATGPATADTGVSRTASTTAAARSFTIRAHHGSDASIDLGTSGFSAGDQDLFTSSLTRNGHHAGRLVGSCTTVRVGKTADQLCEFVLRLGNGQITASGTASSGQSGPGTFTLPILGGTGRYQGSVGQVAVTATNGSSFPIQVSLR